MELDEVSQLLDVSKDQYDEILSIVQHHADETVDWLSNMAAEFGWVGQTLANSSMDPEHIFRITKVTNKEKKAPKGFTLNVKSRKGDTCINFTLAKL